MAALITTWEQTGVYDPTNPNQRSYIRFAQVPGTYASYYYNKVPTSAKLQGALDSLPTWASTLLVAGLAVGAGYLGARALPTSVRRKLPGLSGTRRARRRRR